MPDQLFCYIRKRWIKSTPEEKIRQFLIKHLTENLNYPLHSFVIEKGLDCFSHLSSTSLSPIPFRRLDLLIVAKNLHPNHSLYPLMLIECKATPLNKKAMRQVLGYNHFLKACFVALANQDEIQISWTDQNQNSFLAKEFPPYPVLLYHAKQLIVDF